MCLPFSREFYRVDLVSSCSSWWQFVQVRLPGSTKQFESETELRLTTFSSGMESPNAVGIESLEPMLRKANHGLNNATASRSIAITSKEDQQHQRK